MAVIEMKTYGVSATVGKLNRAERRLIKGADEANRAMAYDLRDRVRAHAQGRPGPEKISGEYWDSITVEVVPGDNFLQTLTGTIQGVRIYRVVSRHPAARRLENGFVGTDNLGRVYAQPPYPHWRPAIEEQRQAAAANYQEFMRKALQEAR